MGRITGYAAVKETHTATGKMADPGAALVNLCNSEAHSDGEGRAVCRSVVLVLLASSHPL